MKWSAEKELYLLENFHKYPIKVLAKHLDICTVTLHRYAKELGLKKERSKLKTKDRIEKLGYKILDFNKGKIKVECLFCSNPFWTTSRRLWTKHTRSCGCTAIHKRTGTEHISGTFWDRLLRGARTRNIPVEIDINDIENLYIKQNGKCKLTNRILLTGYIDIKDITLSVDRIDSSKGYTKDNIQLLHKEVNLAKQSTTQTEFIKMCREVSQHAS